MFNIKQIPDEKKCRELLDKIILGNVHQCPHCKKYLYKKKQYYWCRYCRKKIYPKSLTWLRKTRLTAREILIIVHCWQHKVPPGSIKSTLGISYTTTCRWYSRFRKYLPQDTTLLNGIIEVDEAFFGRKKYNNQKIVAGAVKRETGQIRLRQIPDREQDSLEYFLYKNVHLESLIHTDCWTSYYDICWNGYGHTLHNHTNGEFGGTARAENIWSVAKRQLRRMYYQIRTLKLDEFLIEWEARWNFPELFNNPYSYLEVCLFQHS